MPSGTLALRQKNLNRFDVYFGRRAFPPAFRSTGPSSNSPLSSRSSWSRRTAAKASATSGIPRSAFPFVLKSAVQTVCER